MKDGNNTEDMNLDDLNIKSHLNTSLEFSRISVSEELIQKTLKAINEQPTTLVENEERIIKAKNISWNSYARRLTAAAAALIVFIGGYSIIKSSVGMKSTKKDSGIYMESNLSKDDFTSKDDLSSFDMAQPKTESPVSESDQVLFSATARDMDDATLGTAKEDYTIASEDEQDMKSGSLSRAGSYDGGPSAVGFGQVYGGTADVIESIVITDDGAGKSVIITEEAELLKVYSLLDSYLYRAADSGLSSNIYYSIDIKEYQSDGINTITIGDTVTISSETENSDSTQAYEMINLEEFNHELKVLIESYSN